jgi:hypothetical protein
MHERIAGGVTVNSSPAHATPVEGSEWHAPSAPKVSVDGVAHLLSV